MTIERKTFIDQVTIDNAGVIMIRYKKALIEDNKIIAFEYHRTVVEPGVNPDDQFKLVDNDFASMGIPLTPIEDKDKVKKLVSVVHTPEKIKEYKNKQVLMVSPDPKVTH